MSEDKDIDPQEKARVKHLLSRIEHAGKTESWRKFEKSLPELRNKVRGKIGDEQARTNVIHATLQTILPRIYAKNPEIAATPAESIDGSAYRWVRPFAKTLSLVVNRQLEDAKLKTRVKSQVRSTQTTGLGWIKCTYQVDIEQDPQIASRIQDTQDNLRRIEYLMEQIEGDEPAKADDLDNQKQELTEQLRALEAEAEVVHAEGICLDRVLTENIRIDPDIDDPSNYAEAEWIAQRMYYTPSKFKEVFGKDAEKATRYERGKKQDQASEQQTDAQGELSTVVCVWELWDRMAQTVYTLCEGLEEYARPPWSPQAGGERFYPFFLLFFNPVDGQFLPLSDVELLDELQREYHMTRENQKRHRGMSLPGWVGDIAIDPKDVKSFEVAGLGEILLLNLEGRDVRQILQDRPNPNYDPQIYDTTPIRADIDMVSGTSDAARSGFVKAKTATEAAFLEENLDTKTAERRDVVEDMIADLGKYVAELLLQRMSSPMVSRIAGPGATWPQLRKDDIFDLVQIEVRAGTSGKPNQAQEREIWTEIFPLIKEAIGEIAQLREQGMNDIADAQTTLLAETMRRFDERIDIEEFLPGSGEQEQSEEQQPAGPADEMGMAQFQMELENAQAKIDELRSKTALNYARAAKEQRSASEVRAQPSGLSAVQTSNRVN